MMELGTLWVGDRLGAMEQASLYSFVEQGHAVTVYSYAPIANLPKTVEWRDANEVMPTGQILFYKDKKKPSPSLHSNLFRYAMMARTPKVWVDTDIIALRPIETADYIFGLETPTSANTAVLRLPPDSPALRDLLQFRTDTRGVPPHITGLRRAKYWVKTLGRGLPIDRWGWGSTGPRALTICLTRHDELKYALPAEVFYPVGVEDHGLLLEPGRLTDDGFPATTRLVHLWGSRIREALRRDYDDRLPPDSFLGRWVARARAAGYPD